MASQWMAPCRLPCTTSKLGTCIRYFSLSKFLLKLGQFLSISPFAMKVCIIHTATLCTPLVSYCYLVYTTSLLPPLHQARMIIASTLTMQSCRDIGLPIQLLEPCLLLYLCYTFLVLFLICSVIHG